MKLKLIAVRLSYPSLVKPRGFDESTPEEDKRYESTFLLDKTQHAQLLKDLTAAANQMLVDKYGKTVPKGFKFCLRDGSEKADTDGYGDGVKFISSSSKKQPVLVNQAVQPVSQGNIDKVFYAGCYVNAFVRLWIQDNKFGKRINCELMALQKHSDGNPFGEAPVNAEEEFEAIDGADSAGFGALDDAEEEVGGLL